MIPRDDELNQDDIHCLIMFYKNHDYGVFALVEFGKDGK